MNAARICCLDLDTFFVSVERLLDPRLVNKPVVVGGRRGERGVVTAASYEVRAFGVHSAMPMSRAVRLAPHAIFLPTRHGVYDKYARRVRERIERFCPVVQMASIDEFFLDLHGCERLYRRLGDGDDDATIERAVRELTHAIEAEIGLPSSAGIAASKAVAKIASGLAKPRGVLLVPPATEAKLLAPLPVGRYPGLGPVAQRRLARIGVKTLGQLAALPPEVLRPIVGSFCEALRRGLRGQAPGRLGRDRPAFREHDPVGETLGSISNERTFFADVGDGERLEATLCALAERVCWRARRRGVTARTITLKLRYADFETITRSRTVAPTSDERAVFGVLRQLLRQARTRALPIRLLGVALSHLGPADAGQLQLFDRGEARRLGRAVDAIRGRYGFHAVHLAPARAGASAVGKEGAHADPQREQHQQHERST